MGALDDLDQFGEGVAEVAGAKVPAMDVFRREETLDLGAGVGGEVVAKDFVGHRADGVNMNQDAVFVVAQGETDGLEGDAIVVFHLAEEVAVGVFIALGVAGVEEGFALLVPTIVGVDFGLVKGGFNLGEDIFGLEVFEGADWRMEVGAHFGGETTEGVQNAGFFGVLKFGGGGDVREHAR